MTSTGAFKSSCILPFDYRLQLYLSQTIGELLVILLILYEYSLNSRKINQSKQVYDNIMLGL